MIWNLQSVWRNTGAWRRGHSAKTLGHCSRGQKRVQVNLLFTVKFLLRKLVESSKNINLVKMFFVALALLFVVKLRFPPHCSFKASYTPTCFFYAELFISVSHFLSSASVLSLYIYCLFLTIVCVYLIICLGVYFFMANERFSFFLQSNVFRCWSSCRAMG